MRQLMMAMISLAVAALTACGGGSGGGSTSSPAPQAAGSTSSSSSATSNSSSTSSSTSSASVSSSSSSVAGLAGCTLFPAEAIFNTAINDPATFPRHSSSNSWLTKVRSDGGSSLHLHLDMGMNENQALTDTYWGIPYNIVDGTAATMQWLPISFTPTDAHDTETGWPDESDCAITSGSGYAIKSGCQGVGNARFPVPLDAAIKIEGGACNMSAAACPYNDRHLLVWERSSGNCRLWESYYTYKGSLGWHVDSVAAWDLKSFAMRPDGWTSSDAAGLPILPLLLRADEASSGQINHALRVTFRSAAMASAYVWPASHKAGSGAGANVPFGALLRLRADFVIPASWNTQAKAIARAMQVYGIYVADIGSDLYVQGEPSAAWQQATFDQLQGAVTLDKFEFVDTRKITQNPGFSSRSYRAQW